MVWRLQRQNQTVKRLVLLGGGHAHVHCIAEIGRKPTQGMQATLISPFARQVYSGMLPGWIAGHYGIDDCVVPLPPLAQKAGITFLQTAAARVDPLRRVVHCANGAQIPYDILSIDTGPVADLSHLPGAAQHALAVRPIEQFIEGWDRARARLMAGGRRIVMVGAGAAGVELALSMQHALKTAAVKLDFTIVSAADTLPGNVGKRLLSILRERGIRLLGNTMAQRIEAGKVILPRGTLEADLIIVSTGAAAAEWPRASGIKTDERGFILVSDKMQSLSHAEIFAAGDCASMSGFPRPKSGVYAVRAGPPLEQNLRRALTGEAFQAYLPQQRSLYLISTGDRYAVGSWGGLSWEGAWAWRWKDRIDRQFVARYR
jgi:pyridine nucleotide-disulfide oxidoreductase family protein